MNAGANSIVVYGMRVINHPAVWIDGIECLITQVVQPKLGLSPRYDMDPLFMTEDRLDQPARCTGRP
jgi:hypothetical protein